MEQNERHRYRAGQNTQLHSPSTSQPTQTALSPQQAPFLVVVKKRESLPPGARTALPAIAAAVLSASLPSLPVQLPKLPHAAQACVFSFRGEGKQSLTSHTTGNSHTQQYTQCVRQPSKLAPVEVAPIAQKNETTADQKKKWGAVCIHTNGGGANTVRARSSLCFIFFGHGRFAHRSVLPKTKRRLILIHPSVAQCTPRARPRRRKYSVLYVSGAHS